MLMPLYKALLRSQMASNIHFRSHTLKNNQLKLGHTHTYRRPTRSFGTKMLCLEMKNKYSFVVRNESLEKNLLALYHFDINFQYTFKQVESMEMFQ